MSMLVALALFCLVVGIASGFLAGLFGIGGGMIMVAALAFALPYVGVPDAHRMHMALATSLACIVLTAIASTRAHARRDAVMWSAVAWLAPGLVLGGWIGALLAGRAPDAWLRIGFAIYCFVTAATLLAARKIPANDGGARAHGPLLGAAALPIGALSALVGIGGGSMLVPLLVGRGHAAVRAVGTSAACGLPVALASALGYVFAARHTEAALPLGSIGYVHLPAAAVLALGSTTATRHGAALAHRLAHHQLNRAFAALLMVMGIAMLIAILR
ncbi:MAG TPA: sulfite exporter TauE/SafE family protein [Patescibacteria group bacterium]|nr:sulfite exporter TauE/SafE family protein [Patescibacteria group bacterium]